MKLIKVIYESLFIIFKTIRFYLTTKNTKVLADFRKNVGEECVIIAANGPSLNKDMLCTLKDKPISVCCVNFFPVKNKKLFLEIKPKYLCLADPLFGHREDKRVDELFTVLETTVTWDMVLIAPSSVPMTLNNANITISNINANSICYEGDNQKLREITYKLYQKNRAIPGLQNVMIGACYYFINLHPAHILIDGLDMNEFQGYSINKDNEVFVRLTHDYGTELVRSNIPKGSFYQMIKAYAKMFEQFYHISQYAKYRDVRIHNLTEQSFVDVFEKKNWKEALEECVIQKS